MRRVAVALSVCAFVACGPLSPPKTDAGAGGGGAVGGGGGGAVGGGMGGGAAGGGAGGGLVGGGGGALGGGTGGGAGGGTQDAGTPDAGLGPFQFGQVLISGATSSSAVVGMSGVSGDVWALQDSGHLLHSTGGAFSTLFKFSGGGRDVYVTGSTVVVALYRALRVCTSNCTSETAFSDFDLVSLGLDAFAVCGRGTDIYAITEDTTYGGGLYQFSTGQWMSVGALPIRYPRSCWVDDAGVLWVTGGGGVVRYDGQSALYESLTQDTSLTFYGGASIAGETWAVGAGQRVARRGTGSWTVEQRPQTGTTTLNAIGGVPDAVFALGSVTQGTAVRYLEWDGGTWTEHQDALPGLPGFGAGNVVLPLSDREIYFGGVNDTAPWIARGTR